MTIEPLDDPAGHRRPRMVVVPGNYGGSVQHFYHFLLGYLLPFLEQCHRLRPTHRFMFRDCGPMNDLLRQLDGFLIDTLPANFVLSSLVGLNKANSAIPRIIVPGFDLPSAYERDRFVRCRKVMQALYGAQIAAASAKYPATASDRLVLVIDRAPPHPFYNTAASENRSAGAARRSVPNMAEIGDMIAARHDVLLVRLEECSLFEQIHLFSRAWRVVGQHGAGLAHMIWARPDAGLVEIIPNPGRQALEMIPNADYFRGICDALAMAWCPVLQADQHAAVPPEEILAALPTHT
jgi:hypothetical protein